MASKTPAKFIIGIGFMLFITGVVMKRYFPASHPALAFVISSCATGMLVVGMLNFWQASYAAKKVTSKP